MLEDEMTEFTEAREFEGRTLVDRDGEKIGKVDEVYTDREGGQPEWALVNTGLFGTKKNFVPLRGASTTGEDVRVPVVKEQVKDAPQIDTGQELSEEEERRLFEHYGVPYTTEGTTTARGGEDTEREIGAPPERGGSEGAVGRDVSDPKTDDAMTRSEEEVRVGTRERERGRLRLHKYVVTEEVQQTVPVRREEIRVEREPITDANLEAATSGPEISEEEHEVVLHEEEPVVEKRVVPKERVRMEKDTTTDEQRVSEEVRKEKVDVDDTRERT
jgi:uncharacterized protein (TIGR02271 family)